MPKKTVKNRRKQTAKPSKKAETNGSGKTEFVRPLAFMDSNVIMMSLQLVKISGAAAEDLVRLKQELRRVTAPVTPEESLLLRQQAEQQKTQAQ